MDKVLDLGDTYLAYKKYFYKHIEQYETIEGYEAVDFDPTPYPDLSTKLDQLVLYLNELKPYVLHLLKAAELRQRHYEEYFVHHFVFGNQIPKEEDGHRKFREAFNEVARDALEKLTYWSEISDQLFAKVIDISDRLAARERKRIAIDHDLRNVDFQPVAVLKEKFALKVKKIVRRPTLTKKEKLKRQNERKKRKLAKLEEDIKHAETSVTIVNERMIEEARLVKERKFDPKKINEQIRQVKNGPEVVQEIRSKANKANKENHFVDLSEDEKALYRTIGMYYAHVYYFLGRTQTPIEKEPRFVEIKILIDSNEFWCEFITSAFVQIIIANKSKKLSFDELYEDFFNERVMRLIRKNFPVLTLQWCYKQAFKILNNKDDKQLLTQIYNKIITTKGDEKTEEKIETLEKIIDDFHSSREFGLFSYDYVYNSRPKVFTTNIEDIPEYKPSDDCAKRYHAKLSKVKDLVIRNTSLWGSI